jgi:hypothetical protein
MVTVHAPPEMNATGGFHGLPYLLRAFRGTDAKEFPIHFSGAHRHRAPQPQRAQPLAFHRTDAKEFSILPLRDEADFQ